MFPPNSFIGLPLTCPNLIVRYVWQVDISLASDWHPRCHPSPALHCPPDDSDHSGLLAQYKKSTSRESFHLCWLKWPAVLWGRRRGEERWGCWHSVTSVTPLWHMCSHPHQWMTIRPKHLSYKNWKQYSPPTRLESLTPISHTAGLDQKYNALSFSYLSRSQ